MLKDLRQGKIGQSTRSKVSLKCFPACTTDDMNDYIKPTLRKRHTTILMNVGTNDTAKKNATEIVAGIDKLCDEIKNNLPETNVIISELINRDDDRMLNDKVNEVNKELSKYCDQKHKVSLLKHKNINSKALNGSKLHLNRNGTVLLAKNIIDCINTPNSF